MKARNRKLRLLKTKKAMMQLALAFTTVSLANKYKFNCDKRRDKSNRPTGKAHRVMTAIIKEFEPEDTMAEMEMERALLDVGVGVTGTEVEELGRFRGPGINAIGLLVG